MGQPNLYMPVSARLLQRKIDLLNSHFGSQRSKQWFDAETFLGLARLRGWNVAHRNVTRKRSLRVSLLWCDWH